MTGTYDIETFVTTVKPGTDTGITAYADNAGGVHVSDGRTAWFLGFDYRDDLAEDLAAWAAGDWQPNENDGQTPESLDDYRAGQARTDSRTLAAPSMGITAELTITTDDDDKVDVREGGILVGRAYVERDEDPEPYDAAVRAIIGGRPFAWID